MRIRFFCCLMLAIGAKTPARAGGGIVPERTGSRRVAAYCGATVSQSTPGPGETADPAAATAVPAPAAVGRRRLAVSTAIFALATGLSRVLGLAREMVAAYFFGASGRINAFTIAFQFPNLVRALVADAALSSAFVPVFSDLL